MKHREIGIVINGKSIVMDQRIIELIALLNSIKGIETYTSCQGEPGTAYVQFGGPRAFEILPLIAAGIAHEQKNWKVNHEHDCKGCQSMSVTLEIDGGGMCLRWMPWDYERVLNRIKNVTKQFIAER